MKTNELYFLKVAKNLNISKTASELYISQQDLSRHIHKLEKEYNAPLFYRKPKLELTPYGEALKSSLERISIIEDSLRVQFHEIRNGTVGKIRFGIHFTRARVVLPQIYPKYSQLFPDVTLSVVYDETPQLEKMLLRGDIDIMLGVNAEVLPEMQEHYITTESVFLIIPNQLLSQHFGSQTDSLRKQFHTYGADIEKLQKLPLISNASTSQSQKLLNNLLLKKGIQLQSSLSSTDHYGNIALAGMSSHMCCCPQTLLHAAQLYNVNKPESEQLAAFPIQEMASSLRLSLLTSKDRFFPRYFQAFIHLASEEILNISQQFKGGIL